MESSDLDLIRRIAARDSDAFAEFYDRHAPVVYPFISRLLHGATGADDVLQEVFWQVWERARLYDPSRSPVRTWLFLLARSRAFDYRRRNRVSAVEPTVPHAEEGATVPDDPSVEVERSDVGQNLSAALGGLPAEQATVVALAFLDGLSHAQISERLGIPLGTVKTRIRTGLTRLRASLKPDLDPCS